jgi:hypothetical protein
VTERKQALQGCRELLPKVTSHKELHGRNAALDRVNCLTDRAAAVFYSETEWMSAWSYTTAQPDDRGSTSPKFAVGLSVVMHFKTIVPMK